MVTYSFDRIDRIYLMAKPENPGRETLFPWHWNSALPAVLNPVHPVNPVNKRLVLLTGLTGFT
jgi:hypothetical protein